MVCCPLVSGQCWLDAESATPTTTLRVRYASYGVNGLFGYTRHRQRLSVFDRKLKNQPPVDQNSIFCTYVRIYCSRVCHATRVNSVTPRHNRCNPGTEFASSTPLYAALSQRTQTTTRNYFRESVYFLHKLRRLIPPIPCIN